MDCIKIYWNIINASVNQRHKIQFALACPYRELLFLWDIFSNARTYRCSYIMIWVHIYCDNIHRTKKKKYVQTTVKTCPCIWGGQRLKSFDSVFLISRETWFSIATDFVGRCLEKRINVDNCQFSQENKNIFIVHIDRKLHAVRGSYLFHINYS